MAKQPEQSKPPAKSDPPVQPPPPPPPPPPPKRLSDDQHRHLHLAGTVAIPQRFPPLGRIWYFKEGVIGGEKYEPAIIRVEHDLALSTCATRTCLVEDVSAIFIPNKADNVQFSNGRWLLGSQIKTELPKLQDDLAKKGKAVLGIVYVHEAARTHMEVSMGMTAANSTEQLAALGACCCGPCDPFPCDPGGHCC